MKKKKVLVTGGCGFVGREVVRQLLEKDYDVEFYDFSGIIKEPKYYQDHDHLNTAGVELFVSKYLKYKI